MPPHTGRAEQDTDRVILDALSFGIVYAGLSPESFARLTTDEWDAVVRSAEEKLRTEWEQTRLITYAALAPHIKSGTTMHDLFPLPWDKQQPTEQVAVPTEEERRELIRRYGE